jgi:hypothetical protein
MIQEEFRDQQKLLLRGQVPMSDINDSTGLVRWKSQRIRKVIISGDKNGFTFTGKSEYFLIGIAGGCRFRYGNDLVAVAKQDLGEPIAYAFIKNNPHATASFSVARNEAYSRHALMSSIVSRGKFLKIVS